MSDLPADSDVFDVVEEDLRLGFDGVFSPAGEAFARVDATMPSAEGPTAVVWQYNALHDGDFLGLTPTNQELLIEGVTIATPGPDGWQLALQ